MNQNDSRRNFLRNSALGILGAGVLASGTPVFAGDGKTQESEEIKIKSFRTLGRTGFKVSDISSGGIRDEALLNALLDAGVNYIDTAESYGRGKSETAVGNVLQKRDRKSIFVTTKLVVKEEDTKETILSRARKCLERLKTDYMDCLMLHSAPTVKSIKSEPFHAAVKQLKSEGRLRFVGISNHGSQWKTPEDSMEKVCLAAAADGRFDVMLFVYNFVQEAAGEKILAACKEKNIGVTLMKTNPVGAYLQIKSQMEELKKSDKPVPKFYTDVMPSLEKKADKAEEYIKAHNLQNPGEIRDAAVKFALNHPAVHTVCCSVRNFDDVENYLKLSGSPVTPSEKKKLAAFKEGCGQFYCRHACGVCEAACPHNVPVNTIMRYDHYFQAQGREKHAMQKYAGLRTAKPDVCHNCSGRCQDACPYGVPVQALLTLAHRRLILA
jgi:predicted aldo/keto reductase-like oxidoreductase